MFFKEIFVAAARRTPSGALQGAFGELASLRRGIASLCIGGGEATAVAVELL
jgi:acetyl-CoA acetyltransferase